MRPGTWAQARSITASIAPWMWLCPGRAEPGDEFARPAASTNRRPPSKVKSRPRLDRSGNLGHRAKRHRVGIELDDVVAPPQLEQGQQPLPAPAARAVAGIDRGDRADLRAVEMRSPAPPGRQRSGFRHRAPQSARARAGRGATWPRPDRAAAPGCRSSRRAPRRRRGRAPAAVSSTARASRLNCASRTFRSTLSPRSNMLRPLAPPR